MKANPRSEFFIFDGKVYYNNTPDQSGSVPAPASSGVTRVRIVPAGAISLYEYNIDRPLLSTDKIVGTTGSFTERGGNDNGWLQYTNRIYPWISKDSARSAFKTVGNQTTATTNYNIDPYGKAIVGSYPLSASIVREYIPTSGDGTTLSPWKSLKKNFDQ